MGRSPVPMLSTRSITSPSRIHKSEVSIQTNEIGQSGRLREREREKERERE